MEPIHIRLTTLLSIIFSVALFRLIPHWPNFTPVAALALFGAATFDRKWIGLVAPLAAMLVSDALIGFHAAMGAVYLSFGLTWLLGYYTLSRRLSVGRIATVSVASSVLFFLITNFAVWYGSSHSIPQFYPQTVQGLMACYAAGLAFYSGQSFALNSLLGDLFFCGLLFGGYELLQFRFHKLRKQRV